MPETVISPSNVVIQLAENGKIIGSATNFMVNIDRRKLPVLALGSVDPIAYGRGFRIISGIIDYVILSKDLLLTINDLSSTQVGETIVTNDEFGLFDPIENALWQGQNNTEITIDQNIKLYTMKPITLDMLPPLDLLVYGVDETTGQLSGMYIKGLEFTSSAYVATVNDVALAQRAEWVAKMVTPWTEFTQTVYKTNNSNKASYLVYKE